MYFALDQKYKNTKVLKKLVYWNKFKTYLVYGEKKVSKKGALKNEFAHKVQFFGVELMSFKSKTPSCPTPS